MEIYRSTPTFKTPVKRKLFKGRRMIKPEIVLEVEKPRNKGGRPRGSKNK